MTNYAFTDDVRRSLQYARVSAEQLNSSSVQPVHILLGVSQVPGPTTTAALTELGVTFDQISAAAGVAARNRIRPGDTSGVDLPYTRAAKDVLEDAMSAALRLQHQFVGCEHLLLGVVAPRSPLAAPLGAIGLSAAALEAAVRNTVPGEPSPARPSWVSAGRDPVARLIALVALALGAAALWFALARQ